MSDPEVLDSDAVVTEGEMLSPGALAQVTSAEVNQMVATAKQWPRRLRTVDARVVDLISSSQDVAAACSYAIPRDGKVIIGPSVRFAEIIFSAWMNCRSKSRTVDEGSEYITAEGMFFDVETNTAISCEVKMRIVDREGRRYSHDMIVNTANAAGSKAARTAILRGIPKAWWQKHYDYAQKVVAGDVRTLPQRRDAALALFKSFGMTPAMLCQVVGVEAVSELTIEHLTTLQAILNALRDKETTVEELMRNTQNRDVAEKGAHTVDQIKAKYRKPEVKPASAEQIARAQAKLDEKRKQAQAQEPVKAAEVIEAKKEEKQPEPF